MRTGDDALGEMHFEALRGGGIATAGVGLSMRADGVRDPSVVIELTDVPVGATVEEAWLYRAIWKGSQDAAELASNPVTGTLIGTSPGTGWQPASPITTYRADVSAIVTGNGNYTVSGLPSSAVAADTNGAGLVVLYSQPSADFDAHGVPAHRSRPNSPGTAAAARPIRRARGVSSRRSSSPSPQ